MLMLDSPSLGGYTGQVGVYSGISKKTKVTVAFRAEGWY